MGMDDSSPPERERRQGQRRRHWGRRTDDGCLPVRPRVLIVDPHDDTRSLYNMVFEEAGFAVYAAANGADALTVLRQRLPDLVITETSVPQVDGFRLIRAIRETPSTRDIPVLVVTANVHQDAIQRARTVGATELLRKPTSVDLLLRTADDLLQATPSVRLMRRRLRRTVMTIAQVGAHTRLNQDAQRRVRALIDRLQVAVLALDDNGRHLAASAGAESLTGYTRAELLAMSIEDLVSAAERPRLPSLPARDLVDSDLPQLMVRDKLGTTVAVDALVRTVLPGLHVAAFTRLSEGQRSVADAPVGG
jgi:PAS domain S-box-containing protein